MPTSVYLQVRVFATIFLGYAGLYLLRNNGFLLMPLLVEQGHSRQTWSDWMGCASMLYGISKYCMGRWIDQTRFLYALPLSLVLTALSAIGFRYGSSRSVWYLLLCGMGWFGGMAFPACTRLLVDWFPQRLQGRLLALWSLAHQIGGLLLPAMMHKIVTQRGACWQAGFYLPGCIVLLLALFLLYLLPTSDALPNATRKQDATSRPPASGIWRDRSLLLLGLLHGLVQLIRIGFLDWIPSYLYETQAHSLVASGYSHTAFFIGGMLGGLFGGIWLDRRKRLARDHLCRPLVISFALLLGTASLFQIPWMRQTSIGLFSTIGLFGYALYGPVIQLDALVLFRVPNNQAASATGMISLMGYCIGSLLATTGFGRLVQRHGWKYAGSALLIAILASIAFSLLLAKIWSQKTTPSQ